MGGNLYIYIVLYGYIISNSNTYLLIYSHTYILQVLIISTNIIGYVVESYMDTIKEQCSSKSKSKSNNAFASSSIQEVSTVVIQVNTITHMLISYMNV